MGKTSETLETVIRKQLAAKIPPEVSAIAAVASAAHEPGVAAVIAYGSCLRGTRTSDSLIDLYVLTRDLKSVSSNPLSRILCAMLPPNVYYAEASHGGHQYRAKYAVLPLQLFARKMAPAAFNPYFWARFSQPCALVSARNEKAREEIVSAVSQAVRTMLGESLPLVHKGDSPVQLWERGLRATYGTELRSEPGTRAAEIAAASADRYTKLTAKVLGENWRADAAGGADAKSDWRLRRWTGKLYSALRLMKAAFTFQGGADYLAWKITRHSGVPVQLTPWQRRHPVLAAVVLLPRLLKAGAVR